MKKNSLIAQKWHKFKKNPDLFFEDMFRVKKPINKLIRKILKLKKNPKSFFKDMFKRENFQSQANFEDKMPIGAKSDQLSPFYFNFQIDFNKTVQILPPKTKMPENLTNIFVYKSLEIDFVNKLFELLENKDSTHLNKKNVTCAELVHCSNTCQEMLEKTNVSIRNSFCNYDNFILFNPEINICQVIYSLSNTFRVIVIFSDISLFDTKYFDCCDAIIVKTKKTLTQPKFKRFFYVKTDEMVALALKKIISEGLPQNPDNLIPVYGIPLPDRDLSLDFQGKIYGGIIYIDQIYQITTGTQREQIFAMVPFIKHIAITSSIFNKNLDACLEVMKGHDVANFILRTLNDGVLFDVKKI